LLHGDDWAGGDRRPQIHAVPSRHQAGLLKRPYPVSGQRVPPQRVVTFHPPVPGRPPNLFWRPTRSYLVLICTATGILGAKSPSNLHLLMLLTLNGQNCMQLKTVHFDAYKSLLNSQLDFSHQCLALVGINESGKSNVLAALASISPKNPITRLDSPRMARELSTARTCTILALWRL
jgi:hypothetical protein